jgi:hypothetical protein
MRRDPTFEPMSSEPPEGDVPPPDPYDELENVFDEPILLEDADFPMSSEGEAPGEDPSLTQLQGNDEITRRLWARLGALEGEIRRGSERTLEALRRLGERMGAELAMLDKRAINLELTVARLRAITEAVEAATHRSVSEREAAPSSSASPAPPQAAPSSSWDVPSSEPTESPQERLPGTQPEPPDWAHPSFGPPPDDEPPDDR